MHLGIATSWRSISRTSESARWPDRQLRESGLTQTSAIEQALQQYLTRQAPPAGLDRRARVGKGSGHPAQRNFGACFSYALAKDDDARLLWKGDDFGHTDLRRAV